MPVSLIVLVLAMWSHNSKSLFCCLFCLMYDQFSQASFSTYHVSVLIVLFYCRSVFMVCFYISCCRVLGVFCFHWWIVWWVWQHCRISQPRFLAECCKRRLNRDSFVLLYFALFAFAEFMYCLYFKLVFCPVFSSVNQHEWHSVA